MTDFEKLIQKLLVHEAFDKAYSFKNKYSRSADEIRRAREESDLQAERELDQKNYAMNRMGEWDRIETRGGIDNRRRRRDGDLASERQRGMEEEDIEHAANNSIDPTDDELKSKIIAEALKRTGSPKKEIVELNSISILIRRMISSSKAKNSNEYSYQSFGYIHQQFESKSGMMSISLAPYFYFDENTKDLTKVRDNGIIDISFKASGGSYADVTGSGDATQVIATVMEYAFAVFSVVESALKILFPDFYEWKKSKDQKIIKFSGVNNFGGINPNAKTAREGTNKRNRLYSLGWDRAMRKRATDLELYDGGHGTIYIKYKAPEGSEESFNPPWRTQNQ